MSQLQENRQRRAKEEKERQDRLRRDWEAEQRKKQDALDKELAVINARKALEDKAKEINRDVFVQESLQKMESELDFGAFSFKF